MSTYIVGMSKKGASAIGIRGVLTGFLLEESTAVISAVMTTKSIDVPNATIDSGFAMRIGETQVIATHSAVASPAHHLRVKAVRNKVANEEAIVLVSWHMAAVTTNSAHPYMRCDSLALRY